VKTITHIPLFIMNENGQYSAFSLFIPIE